MIESKPTASTATMVKAMVERVNATDNYAGMLAVISKILPEVDTGDMEERPGYLFKDEALCAKLLGAFRLRGFEVKGRLTGPGGASVASKSKLNAGVLIKSYPMGIAGGVGGSIRWY